MPMPVKDERCVPVDLYWQRRDFGITAAVVAVIATTATAARIALFQTVQMAETVNQLAKSIAESAMLRTFKMTLMDIFN